MIARMDANTVIKLLGVIVVFGLIVLIDLSSLLKTSDRRKTMFIYFFIIAINLTISLLLVSGVEIISPAVVLEKLVRLVVPGKSVE